MVRVLVAPWRSVGERKMGEYCGDREVWRSGLVFQRLGTLRAWRWAFAALLSQSG